jgi:hypothetical protein
MDSSWKGRFQIILPISAVLLVGLAALSRGSPTSFWVWQRSTVLSSDEKAEIERFGVRDLYWQIGTITPQGDSWKWTERFPADFDSMRKEKSGLHLVPVVRLEPPPRWSFSTASTQSLENLLSQIAKSMGSRELQIDYEAPDRSIPAYLRFLQQLKAQRSWRLSVTALAHWSKYTPQLVGLVDEITPMFYDLDPGRESLRDGRLANLTDPISAETELDDWKKCPIPWKAGLPNFSRVTVIDVGGASRGHLRSWAWDDVWFSPILEPLAPTTDGQTIFSVLSSGILGVTPLRAGEKVIVRYPDLAQLKQLADKSEQAGSQGVIYFRLADGTDMSGFAVSDLLGEAPEIVTVLPFSADSITLASNKTLMPVVTPNRLRGYALAVKTDGEGWREAVPGQFASISLDPAGTAPAPIDLGLGTTMLYFRFSALQAGGTLKTGLLQHAPKERVRWSVEGVNPEPLWHSLD